jgi:hypothetical protein
LTSVQLKEVLVLSDIKSQDPECITAKTRVIVTVWCKSELTILNKKSSVKDYKRL